MSTITIWHNPKCSKSRNSMALLEEKGVNINIIKYLETSPSKKQLIEVLKQLNLSAKDLIRTGESIYKELNLKNVADENILINAMVENPKLIERPIVIKGDKAVIGRPIENVEKLLG